MLMLVTENPTSGLRLESEDIIDREIGIGDVLGLDNEKSYISIQGVSPSFFCMLAGSIWTILKGALFLTITAAIGYIGYKIYNYRENKKAREQDEIYTIMEKVIEILEHHYEETK